jgi:deoxyadenosine/deoxycytidine kinase
MNSRPLIIAIEGNIGVGKSTLLANLKQQFAEHGIRAVFMPEPVDVWSTVTDETGETILSKYYADPAKYAFSFQIMAYTTRLTALRRIIQENPDCDVIVCERSLEADNNIFAKMLFDDKMIEYVQYGVYSLLYGDTAKEYATNGIVYLRADPAKCRERIQRRQRNGEGGISLDYLKKCDAYYEDWLGDHCANTSILRLDTNADVVYGGEDMIAAGWIHSIIQYVAECMLGGQGRRRRPPSSPVAMVNALQVSR